MKQQYFKKNKQYLAIIATAFLTNFSPANADPAGYFVGDYVFFGYDSSLEEMYYGSIKLTENKKHFLDIEITNYQSGVDLYFGHITEVDKNTVKISYTNAGNQEHTATCKFKNDDNNFAEFNCEGSLLGNVGGYGKVVIKSKLTFL